jgi:hypothetical protein
VTTPGSAAELVAELVGLGLSRRQIGRSVGVNDSYIGRILSGARGTTGAKYAGRLAELRAEVDARQAAGVPLRRGETVATAAPVEHRTQRLRRPARVYDGRHATTARVGKQAARNGARALVGELQHAADEGRKVAVDLHTTSATMAQKANYSVKQQGAVGRRRKARIITVTFGPVDADELLPYVEAAGGDLVAGALTWAVETGSYEGSPDDGEAETVVGAEVRTWDA